MYQYLFYLYDHVRRRNIDIYLVLAPGLFFMILKFLKIEMFCQYLSAQMEINVKQQ